MLRIENVTRRYDNGVVALENAELTIETGDFLVLLGPSGCGKSTLLRLIAGLDTPQAGRIAWQKAAPAPGEIGFVFQDPTLMPWATAAQNAALPLRLRGRDSAPASTMLARLGLGGFEAARPAALSGGMRMRVSIARALAPRPRILLMDEPFAALDEFTRNRLQEDLRALAQETGCTTIFVTHSIYEAAFLASRVALMSPRPGRIATTLDFAEPIQNRLDPAFGTRIVDLTRALQAVTEKKDVLF
ncbi:MAG TPA: ABC transporter ATP-binding protein [Acetobacteraceae bacterium]|nr:ABC transporter ATP-binding protein [Acetobacteraceae bacterium]